MSSTAKRGGGKASATTKKDEDKYADLLAPLLARDGALDGPRAVAPLVRDVLPRLPTATSRQLACIVLQMSSPEVLHAFSASEGPELVADWLREALDRAPTAAAAEAANADAVADAPAANHNPFSAADAPRAEAMVLDALKAMRPMPVTRPMLKASRLPKAIGALHKRHPAEGVRRAAGGVMDAWKNALQGQQGPQPSGGGGESGGARSAGAAGGAAGAGAGAGSSGGGAASAATSARCVCTPCTPTGCVPGSLVFAHPAIPQTAPPVHTPLPKTHPTKQDDDDHGAEKGERPSPPSSPRP